MARPQSTPKLLFFPGLLSSKTPRVGVEFTGGTIPVATSGNKMHCRFANNYTGARNRKRPPLPNPLLQRRRRRHVRGRRGS